MDNSRWLEQNQRLWNFAGNRMQLIQNAGCHQDGFLKRVHRRPKIIFGLFQLSPAFGLGFVKSLNFGL